MMTISNLKIAVDGKEILNGLNLDVNEGEVVAVMGKNGSGKSTLAFSIMGHPKYEVTDGQILIGSKDIKQMTPDERANLGIFLVNQYPVAVPGLSVNSFLWQIYKKRNGVDKKVTIVQFRKWVEEQAKMLDLNPELLKRGLNDGFSGGEKKKLETLQMLVFNPKYIILDEIDSGLDVDALKRIAQTVAKVAKDRKIGVIAITHYNRILKYLVPDKVVVMENGKVIKSGPASLAEEIEKVGYSHE